MKRFSSTNRFLLRLSLAALVVFIFSPQGETSAAEIVVGTVDADAQISLELDSDCACNFSGGQILEIPAGSPPPQDFAYGSLFAMEIRGGSDGNVNNRTSKSLIRFAVDPVSSSSLYFLEMTAFFDGNSDDVFFLYAIDDANNDIQNFNESTLTWNNAPANAIADDDSWTATGPEVGRFAAPEADSLTPAGTFRVPLFGSAIDTFASDTRATFGMTSNSTSRIFIGAKEPNPFAPPSPPARIITFTEIASTQSGNLTAGTTYGGAAPAAENLYRVLGAHTVTATGPAFAGEGVIVEGTLAFSASAVDIDLIALRPGGNLTRTGVSGDFAIGDPAANQNAGGLILEGNLTLNADPGADILINIPLRGSADLTFNGNGAGSDLVFRYAVAHQGTITFAGTGDDVIVTEFWGIGGTLLMNSTGANRLVFLDTDDSDDADDRAGTVVFNQPGAIKHSGTGTRLQGVGHLVVNAPLTIDLTETPTTTTAPNMQERRTRLERTLTGSGNISVVGPATDVDIVDDVTRNELEIGRTDEDEMVGFLSGHPEFSPAVNSDYSGTISTSGFVTVEAHMNIPAATVVVNNHGKFTMGFQDRDDEIVIDVGEITVHSGGELVVGHLADDSFVAFQEHEPQGLRLSKDEGASGDLTLMAGSSTVMQISDLTPSTRYDTISVDGTATLGGTLKVLFDPAVNSPDTLQGTYMPTVGDTFDIITANSSPVAGDYDGSGIVESGDYDKWKADFGMAVVAGSGADGNANGIIDAADYTVWRDNEGSVGTAGTITGTFATVNVTDLSPIGALTGLDFQINYVSSSLVQLEVVSAGAGAGIGVPEPASAILISLALAMLSGLRRRVK